MAPEQLKVVAIVLGTASVGFLALAALAWRRSDSTTPEPATPRDGRYGRVLLFVFSAGAVAALWVGADVSGGNRDRTMWLGIGGLLMVLTLTRPRWFWENYKARWLRDLIGDGATTAFYLVLAAMMVWVGLFTDWTFGRR